MTASQAAETVTVPKDTVRTVVATIVTQLARWSWWKPKTKGDKTAFRAAVLAVEAPGDTVTLAAEAAFRLARMSSAETLYELDWCAAEADPSYPMNHPAGRAELDLEGAVAEKARATWERLVDADAEESTQQAAEPEPAKTAPTEPPPDFIGTQDHGGGRGSLGSDGELGALAGRQYAALAEVRIWTWERYAPARRGGPRQREKVQVEKHPGYWPCNLGHESQQICGSLSIMGGDGGLDPAGYREFHGENHELHPVLWRVTWGHAQSTTRMRQHWCDAHLPDEYRPGIPREVAPPVKPRRDKKQPEPSYYATTGHYDRTGQTKLHYWYRVQRGRDEGRIRPWPPGRSHFGVLYKRDIPDEQTCRETFDCTSKEWELQFWEDVKDVRQAAMREIAEHPEEAAARFAVLQSTCCCCGRALTEDRSKAYGIGPECREGAAPEVLKRIGELTAREHAQALREAS
jgi:hypothetical protein